MPNKFLENLGIYVDDKQMGIDPYGLLFLKKSLLQSIDAIISWDKVI